MTDPRRDQCHEKQYDRETGYFFQGTDLRSDKEDAILDVLYYGAVLYNKA
jgi:hypothetical protein